MSNFAHQLILRIGHGMLTFTHHIRSFRVWPVNMHGRHVVGQAVAEARADEQGVGVGGADFLKGA